MPGIRGLFLKPSILDIQKMITFPLVKLFYGLWVIAYLYSR